MINFSYLIILVLVFIMFMKSSYIGKIFGVMSYPDKSRKFHNKSVAQVGGIIFLGRVSFFCNLVVKDLSVGLD